MKEIIQHLEQCGGLLHIIDYTEDGGDIDMECAGCKEIIVTVNDMYVRAGDTVYTAPGVITIEPSETMEKIKESIHAL